MAAVSTPGVARSARSSTVSEPSSPPTSSTVPSIKLKSLQNGFKGSETLQVGNYFFLFLIIVLFLIELLKYNGTAKEVFNISLDLQVILAIFTEGEQEYEMVQ